MSGGRDHIWPFTTDWASCVAPLSNFAHSIHLVTSGDVSPRSQWCTQLTQQTITNQYAHQRCWLQVHSAGSQSYGQLRIVCTSSSCALLHASQGHCNSAPFVGSLSKVPFIHIVFPFGNRSHVLMPVCCEIYEKFFMHLSFSFSFQPSFFSSF